jgi:hypothetical protein
VFSGANLIAVSDDDAGGASVQVDLVATNGTLTLSQTTGLSFTAGADGTATMTFTGSIVDINAALTGMTFTPDLAFEGAAGVQITTNDLGNTGAVPTPQVTTNPVAISVINTPPTLTAQTLSVSENSQAGVLVGTVVATDPDLLDPLTYTIVSGNTGGAFTIDAATGEVRVANPAALDFEVNPTITLQVQVSDSGSPTLSTTAAITVQLTNLSEGTGPDPISTGGPTSDPTPTPEPTPEPEPEPTDDDSLELAGGDEGGGGSPAPAETPTEPEPAPEPPPPVPETDGAAAPVAPTTTAEPAPIVAKAMDEEVQRPEPIVVAKASPQVVAKAMDVNRAIETTTPFRQALDIMSEGVGTTDILEEVQNNTLEVAFKGTSFVLSAGFLTWALRGASLLASVAASLPAWQGFDPLPVLAAKKRDKKKKDEELVEEKDDNDWQEKRIRRLLNPIDGDGEQ